MLVSHRRATLQRPSRSPRLGPPVAVRHRAATGPRRPPGHGPLWSGRMPPGVGLLAANEELPAGALDDVAVLGELGLDGAVRPVPGTLALVDALARAGVPTVVVPAANGAEASLVAGVTVRAARSLAELRACLKG